MSLKSIELTDNQKIHTLAAKKKKSIPTIRHVLVQPFERYWPQLDHQQTHDFIKLLESIRNKFPQWFKKEPCKNKERPIRYGLRESIRNLETGRNKLLAISAELKPRYVVNQIILQALSCNEQINIFCIPNMESLMYDYVKFPCFAFIIIENDLPAFEKLFTWSTNVIQNIHKVPVSISSYFAEGNQLEQMDMNEIEYKELAPHEDNVHHLYLFEENNSFSQRAFIPKNAINLKPSTLKIDPLNQIRSDFISLNTFDHSSPISISKPRKGNKLHGKKDDRKKVMTPMRLYQALTIHKIQGNSNGNKKNMNNAKSKNKMK